MSLAVIAAVGAVVIGGTTAYFSDSEESTGNTFTAGAIDLTLGGTFADFNGPVVLSGDGDTALYEFNDLKPGDMGGGTFNLEVTSNDAYVCAKSTITATPENGVNDPEVKADDTFADGDSDGELQDYLQFATFYDADNSGSYTPGEPINVGQYDGDGNGLTSAEFSAAGWVAVADTSAPNTWLIADNLPTGTQQNAGMLYCFGDFETTGALNNLEVTGCDGSADYNDAQTDGVVGSIEFSAVQTRNNDEFSCAEMNDKY